MKREVGDGEEGPGLENLGSGEKRKSNCERSGKLKRKKD